MLENIIQKSPLFQGIDEAYLQRILLDQKTIQSFKNGDFIVRQNEIGHGMYFILKGEVEIFVTSKDYPGERILIKVLKPGDFFGEVCMFLAQKRTASAKAEGNVELIYLEADKFLNEIKANNPNAIKIGLNIAFTLADHLRHTNDLITELSKPSHHLEPQSEIVQFKKKLMEQFLI